MVRYFTAETNEELQKLRQQHRDATERSTAAILREGTESRAHLKAEEDALQVWARMREILKTAPHWVN